MRKLMLAVLVPMVLGSVLHTQEPVRPMPADASPKFDVATIRPSKPSEPGTQPQGFDLRGRHVLTMSTSVDDLISFAYGVNAKQIIDAPPWSNVDKFDIDGVPDVEGQPNQEQMKMLFQRLLEDRFHLKFHHDQRELSVLALTVAKGGPKLAMTIHAPTDPVMFAFERQIDA